MSEDIPTTLEEVTIVKHLPKSDAYLIEATIGGVVQNITVTEDWYESKVQP